MIDSDHKIMDTASLFGNTHITAGTERLLTEHGQQCAVLVERVGERGDALFEAKNKHLPILIIKRKALANLKHAFTIEQFCCTLH